MATKLIHPKQIRDLAELRKGYIHGAELSWASTAQIQVGTGCVMDDAETEMMELTSPIVCDLSTSGANGLDTGAEAADTWYHLYVIKDTTNGTVATLFSVSSTSPTLPGTYDIKRLVGSFRNNSSSDIIPLESVEGINETRYFQYADPGVDCQAATDVEDVAGSWSTEDLSACVPPTSTWVRLVVHGFPAQNFGWPPGGIIVYLRKGGTSSTMGQVALGVSDPQMGGPLEVGVNSSGQIDVTFNNINVRADIYVVGYFMQLDVS